MYPFSTLTSPAIASLVPCLCCASVWPDAISSGRVIYVSPTGRPGASGTAEAPLASIQEALDRATAGDTVHLLPGLYRERVSFKHSGEYQRPVTLEGEPGAILDGSEPVMLRWTRADDIAPDVWRAPVPFLARTVIAEGKLVTALWEWRVDPETQKDPKWHWPSIFRDGIGPTRDDGAVSGWDGVKALVMYRHEPKELLIRFEDGRDPNATPITISPDEPIVSIMGVNRCVVRGLALRNGEEGVRIEKSVGSVVERCTIGPGEFGVWLREGADRCTVRFNEIFMDPFSGASSKLKGSWDNWLAHKTGGFSDRNGVLMVATVGGHQIHDNFIHDHWDGIEDYVDMNEETGIYAAAGRDHNLNVHHNRIVDCSDDGLEPNGEEVNCEWHDNIVEGCMCGFRIKAPRVGPLYAYRNIFFDNGEDYRNFGGGEIMRPAPVFVYHNTSDARAAISHMAATGVGTPQYHFENNLFWCALPFWVSNDSLLPNWMADHNVYVRLGEHERWRERKEAVLDREQDLHSKWVEDGLPGFVDFAKHDVRLTADSPARGQGADLSTLFGKPLPGCAPGYFSGAAPDAGALQFGEPMPTLPRRPEDVTCPPAGSWPIP
jgi:predicted SnoaL-like aldol condensation-catalyzing enzyme